MNSSEHTKSKLSVWRLSGALCVVLVVALGIWFACQPSRDLVVGPQPQDENSVAEIAEIIQERASLDSTVWKTEVVAQRHEDVFVALWDKLRAADDQLGVLADVPFEQITLGEALKSTIHDGEITETQFGGTGKSLSRVEWKQLLEGARRNKLKIIQTEWHHSRFEISDQGDSKSSINVLIHAVNFENSRRYDLSGELNVAWSKPADNQSLPRLSHIDARKIRIIERSLPVPFEEAMVLRTREMGPFDGTAAILVYDVDQDGLSDIVLPTWNRLLQNLGQWKFEKRKLLDFPPKEIPLAGVLGDFTGDGIVDLLCAARGRPHLYRGDENGRFSTRPSLIDCVGEDISEPSVLTAGDIDLDGDLDVWLAQYKKPYVLGQMPTPYFDANDGFPAFLLLNDGHGHFEDVTHARGLEAKRHRRTYSGSLVDLDDDGDLDLTVASDFAGLDLYLNDGRGFFQDVTETHVDERHAFGMALTFADYNRDARLDFLMIGMSSTTARRLEQLGLGREEFAEHQRKRGEMGYGNRMYLADERGFQQAPFNDQVARSGWSWGATSFDFDNDGDRDVYVANGHHSGQTAKDYCTKYWCHDIYAGTSEYDPKLTRFFDDVIQKDQRMSWNGFEHNCLFMNESGAGFLRVDFLMGVAIETDSRHVVSDDFDGDGKMDLLVVSVPQDEDGMKIQLLRNTWKSANHWIGVLPVARHSARESSWSTRVVFN